VNKLISHGNNMDNILAWPPCNPDSPFCTQVEIMVPVPTLENLA